MSQIPEKPTRSLRGFASMDKQRQREIASKGGRSAHEKGTAHEFSSEEASMAAKFGHLRGTAHHFTSEEARLAGRKGGLARAANRNRNLAAAAGGNGSPESGSSASAHNSPEVSTPSSQDRASDSHPAHNPQ